MKLLLALTIIATPLAAQSSTTPQDTTAIRAAVEDSVHIAAVRRIVADTAWVVVVDRRTPTVDIPSHGKGTDSGTAIIGSEVRVERRRGRWVVTAARMYDTPQSDTVTVRVLFDGPGGTKIDTIRSKPKP